MLKINEVKKVQFIQLDAFCDSPIRPREASPLKAGKQRYFLRQAQDTEFIELQGEPRALRQLALSEIERSGKGVERLRPKKHVQIPNHFGTTI